MSHQLIQVVANFSEVDIPFHKELMHSKSKRYKRINVIALYSPLIHYSSNTYIFLHYL